MARWGSGGKQRSRASTLPPLPSLIAETPPKAQVIGHKVQRSEWADPTDLRPNQRRAHRVGGWRSTCALRWCRDRHGEQSGFTVEHVAAADELRRVYDLATLGMTGRTDPWIYRGDILPRPKLGPSPSEVANYRAWKEIVRVRRRYNEAEWELLTWYLLANLSIGRWTQRERTAGRECNPRKVQRKLVALMDVLVEVFADAIRKHGVGLAA